jgi:hypothetical protein
MPSRQLLQAIDAGRQLGFFDDHDGEAVFDGEFQAALLADEMIAFEVQARLALGVHRAAEDFEQVGADHGKNHCRTRKTPRYSYISGRAHFRGHLHRR